MSFLLIRRKIQSAYTHAGGTTMAGFKPIFRKFIAEEDLRIAEQDLHIIENKLMNLEMVEEYYKLFENLDSQIKNHEKTYQNLVAMASYLKQIPIKQIIDVNEKTKRNLKEVIRVAPEAYFSINKLTTRLKNDQKRLSAAKQALKEDIIKADADIKRPFKEYFFKPYQSLHDPIIRAATIFTAPFTLTLLTIDLFVELIIKYLCQSELSKDLSLRTTAQAFCCVLMLLLLAICSPVLNTVDLIGAAYANAAPSMQP